MPREASCTCGTCRLCKQRECQRVKRLRDIVGETIWPQDQWGLEARAEAEQMLAYACALSDAGAGRWAIETRRRTRLAAAE